MEGDYACIVQKKAKCRFRVITNVAFTSTKMPTLTIFPHKSGAEIF